jgi:hypothetical protein
MISEKSRERIRSEQSCGGGPCDLVTTGKNRCLPTRTTQKNRALNQFLVYVVYDG